MLEEYGAEFVHVKGEDNVAANTMSCHPNNGNVTKDVARSGQHMSYVLAHNQIMDKNVFNESTYSNLVTEEDIR